MTRISRSHGATQWLIYAVRVAHRRPPARAADPRARHRRRAHQLAALVVRLGRSRAHPHAARVARPRDRGAVGSRVDGRALPHEALRDDRRVHVDRDRRPASRRQHRGHRRDRRPGRVLARACGSIPRRRRHPRQRAARRRRRPHRHLEGLRRPPRRLCARARLRARSAPRDRRRSGHRQGVAGRAARRPRGDDARRALARPAHRHRRRARRPRLLRAPVDRARAVRPGRRRGAGERRAGRDDRRRRTARDRRGGRARDGDARARRRHARTRRRDHATTGVTRARRRRNPGAARAVLRNPEPERFAAVFRGVHPAPMRRRPSKTQPSKRAVVPEE